MNMYANMVRSFIAENYSIYLSNLVLDFCFGNIMCGKHGRCVNSLESFKCSCSFFFDGVLCDKCKTNFKLLLS
jgi:hypothetical protein